MFFFFEFLFFFAFLFFFIAEIPSVYKFLEYAYPEILIEYTAMIGEFGPPAIRALSYHTHVPTTFMFMGSFGENFNFSFTELGK